MDNANRFMTSYFALCAIGHGVEERATAERIWYMGPNKGTSILKKNAKRYRTYNEASRAESLTRGRISWNVTQVFEVAAS